MKKLFVQTLFFILLSSRVWAIDMPYFLDRANSGDADAQYWLGLYYSDPRENDGKQILDYSIAREWLTKSAEQNHRKAQYQLALLLNSGKGGEKPNPTEAANWFLKAAENGHKDAQLRMTVFYSGGSIFPKDEQKSLFWLTKAAENDNTFAQLGLSNFYGRQREGHYDPKMQFAWAYVAATRNDMWNLTCETLPRIKRSLSPEDLSEAIKLARSILTRLENLNDPDLMLEVEMRQRAKGGTHNKQVCPL